MTTGRTLTPPTAKPPRPRWWRWPGVRVHHQSGGFGTLLLPWFGGRWWIRFTRRAVGAAPRSVVRLMDRHFSRAERDDVTR